MIWMVEKIIDTRNDIGNGVMGQGDAPTVSINPKPNNLKAVAMFQLFVFKWAANELPEDQELDLSMWSQHPMKKYEIVHKIPSKKVIHEDKEAKDF